jgi:hypothetical protein
MNTSTKVTNEYIGKFLIALGVILTAVIGIVIIESNIWQFWIRLAGFCLALAGFWLIINQHIAQKEYQKINHILLNMLVGLFFAVGFATLVFIYFR